MMKNLVHIWITLVCNNGALWHYFLVFYYSITSLYTPNIRMFCVVYNSIQELCIYLDNKTIIFTMIILYN